ncbi:MAG: DMT family transporter [Alphaproteobacteria bacterium]|nr:DMT family transporter [Alphaproteobacteria bacterium]
MSNNKFKGYLFGIIASISYGLNPLFALPMYKNGLDVDSVLVYRYGLSIIALALLIKFSKKSFRVKKDQIIPLIAMGLFMAGSSLFLFLAYQKMDAGIASAILFVYPVLVSLLMTVFFHEKMSIITIMSLILATVGINLLCKSDGGESSTLGIFYVFLSAICYALYLVGVKVSKVQGMSSDIITFYAVSIGVIVFLFRLRGGVDFIVAPNVFTLLCGIGSAIVCTVISLMATSAGINIVGPTPVAILGALEPVTAVVINVLLFDGILTSKMIIGIVLVVLSVTMIVSGKQISRSARYKKLCNLRKTKKAIKEK